MKSQLVCLCPDSISLCTRITHTPRVRGQGTLSDCLTVGATNRSTLRIFVQVVQNVAHCIGGTLNQSQRGGRGAAAAKGPGQEVGGASHGPGHLSKVNKRVDNWARRWSLRAVSEERSGSRSRGKEGAGKRSQQRDQLRAKRFNFIIKQWGDKVAADFIYGPGLVSRHSTAGTRWHPSLLPSPLAVVHT